VPREVPARLLVCDSCFGCLEQRLDEVELAGVGQGPSTSDLEPGRILCGVVREPVQPAYNRLHFTFLDQSEYVVLKQVYGPFCVSGV
jgi:hypothetical protein